MKRSVLFGSVVAGVVSMSPGASGSAPAAPFTPTRFTVTDAGTAGKPDVILIPGLASSKAVWDAEAKLLAPNYRLHIVQVAGFAGAPVAGNATGPMMTGIVEELHQYIAAQGMHPAVIGHSMGGTMTLMLEAKYPADVRKAVLVDALPYLGVLMMGPAATPASTKAQVDVIKQQMIAAPADQYAAMQPIMAEGFSNNADARKLIVASSVGSDRTVTANAMSEDLMTDLRGDVATIKVPTLEIYPYDPARQGADPKVVDAMYAGAFKGMPSITLVRVDGSRHFVMYDQPAKFDAAVEAFLK